MTLATLDHTEKRVIMFGGKGGVGKTTSSAATALHFAGAGRRTLIITSDYTPSLSDIFEVEIGPQERAIPDVDSLCALEIDPDEVMRRWKKKFGPEVYEAASTLVDMPYDELIDYVAMAPGIQEEFMLDYILEHIRKERYDVIVWDTAPAGDTLRLLDLPRRFIKHLRTAPKVYMGVRDAFNLSKTPFLDLIESWKALAQEVTEFFSDPENVEFIRVGRVALVFKTDDDDVLKYFNVDTRSWMDLDKSYLAAIKRGSRVAREQIPPELLYIPVSAPSDGN